MIGSRLLTELDETQKCVLMLHAFLVCEADGLPSAVDRLEGELMTELENARLVRLLCKFGFINERPESVLFLRLTLLLALTSTPATGTTTRHGGLRPATGTSSSSSETTSSIKSTRSGGRSWT